MAATRLVLLMMAICSAVASANESANKRPADACDILPRVDMRLRLTVNSPLVADPSEIQRIVDNVWAAEGLHFRWVPATAPLNSWTGLDAWIVVGHQRVHATKPEAIGSVQFQDDVPSRIIRLSVDAAQAWVVSQEARTYKLHRSFVQLRARTPLARTTKVLGYAAAHEVGHFVLASKTHASHGLMQAAYRDPYAVGLNRLQLDPISRRRLRDRLAAAALCVS